MADSVLPQAERNNNNVADIMPRRARLLVGDFIGSSDLAFGNGNPSVNECETPQYSHNFGAIYLDTQVCENRALIVENRRIN